MSPAFPFTRLRRLRQAPWTRNLFAENDLRACDLIYPIFIAEGQGVTEPLRAIFGQEKRSVDLAVQRAEEAFASGIQLVCLFPDTPSEKRDDQASEALHEDNLLCRAVRAIKERVPDLGLMVDVALDPYTDHGHDGLIRNGRIDNDATIALLVGQALLFADAGADVLAPSDMMDGRIRAIRAALEKAGKHDTLVFSYAAKYASSLYGPFRDAIGATGRLRGDKRTYQMDIANGREALFECELDQDEGADALIVKPAMTMLDVVYRVAAKAKLPVIAYQVSGEYAMIQAASRQGLCEREPLLTETLLGCKRAGASAIISYGALDVAQSLCARP